MAPDPSIAEEIRRFRAQYARNPDGFAFARLADAYRKAGDVERALDLLDRGLERHPRYLSGHVVRARALVEAGRREEALEAYRRVLELDPQNRVALGGLARMADEKEAVEGEAEEAGPVGNEDGERPSRSGPVEGEPVGQEPAAESPGTDPRETGASGSSPGPEDEDVVVTATMGDLLLRQELYEQAVRTFERLLKRRPGDPFLVEKLRTARRLAAGEDLAAEARAREERSGPEGAGRSPDAAREHRGAAGAREGTAGPEETAGRATSAPSGDSGDGGGPPTIRGYLGRLVEGRAEVESDRGASRFEAWVRRAARG